MHVLVSTHLYTSPRSIQAPYSLTIGGSKWRVELKKNKSKKLVIMRKDKSQVMQLPHGPGAESWMIHILQGLESGEVQCKDLKALKAKWLQELLMKNVSCPSLRECIFSLHHLVGWHMMVCLMKLVAGHARGGHAWHSYTGPIHSTCSSIRSRVRPSSRASRN